MKRSEQHELRNVARMIIQEMVKKKCRTRVSDLQCCVFHIVLVVMTEREIEQRCTFESLVSTLGDSSSPFT